MIFRARQFVRPRERANEKRQLKSCLSFLVPRRGFEPPAYCLEGSCSIQLSYWRELNGAGDGNRTRIPSLEGWCPSHCATPACALRKNRQLCYNSISVPFCQRFFRIFLRFFMLSE